MTKFFFRLVVLGIMSTSLLMVGCDQAKETAGTGGAAQGSRAGENQASPDDGDRVMIADLF